MMNSSTKEINLYNILNVTPAITEAVLNIRNEEHVRKWMYTDHLISISEHQKWLKNLKNDERNIVFVVMDNEQSVLGVVSVNAIDRRHDKAEWAYYLTESARSGIGAVLEFYIIDYIFECLGMQKLNCEVIEHNDAVVKLHEKFSFREEGFRESNISKNGARLGVHFLGLTKADWLDNREKLKTKYLKVFSQYTVIIN